VTNRKVHMRFRLAPRSMTTDDLEQLYVRIRVYSLKEFQLISNHTWNQYSMYKLLFSLHWSLILWLASRPIPAKRTC